MHVFLSEYLTCGGMPGLADEKASLAVEGAAMVRALAEDAARVPGWKVTVAWDAALEPFGRPDVVARLASSPEQELELFEKLAGEADVTLVIAPEFDRILESRCRLLAICGGRSAGSTTDAVALCADKLMLSQHLARRGISTIPTRLFESNDHADHFKASANAPFVLKPRFGAGSIDTRIVRSAHNLPAVGNEQDRRGNLSELIAQPFVDGHALSVAGIVSRAGVEMLPVCSQHFTDEKQFHYEGGRVPAGVDRLDQVMELAKQAIVSVPGLHGYVGVDVILPIGAPPVVVEINPRLTSSYHGYRKLAASNLTGRIVQPDNRSARVQWKDETIEFRADGSIRPN